MPHLKVRLKVCLVFVEHVEPEWLPATNKQTHKQTSWVDATGSKEIERVDKCNVTLLIYHALEINKKAHTIRRRTLNELQCDKIGLKRPLTTCV